MILMLESDKAISKKLSDLLDRERIICLDSGKQLLEMIVKYKNDINVIVANNRMFREIKIHPLILKLCQKLNIKPPPVICYDQDGDRDSKKDDQVINEEMMENLGLYKLIEYDELNSDFPEVFIETIKEAYPGLRADVKKASVLWTTKPGEFVDIGGWLQEEGFFGADKTAEPAKPSGTTKPSAPPITAKPSAPKKENLDYEKMYDELKKKYDDLLKQMQNLLNLNGDSKKG
jgi:hypothetical protein